jgi:hypothetical protein
VALEIGVGLLLPIAASSFPVRAGSRMPVVRALNATGITAARFGHGLVGDHPVPPLLERIHRDHLAGVQDPEYRRRIAAFGAKVGPHLGNALVGGVNGDRLRRCSRRHQSGGVRHRRT